MTTQSDMPNCMSKMLTLGMELKEIVYRSTVTPARAISRFPDIGTLGEGKEADVAVLELEDGVFAYHDAWQMKRLGTRRIANVLTVRAGEIVYDRDARAFADWGGTRGQRRAFAQSKPTKQPTEPSGGVAPADPIYDLLLKNGIVIDPSSGRHGRFDVAIVGERIARIAANLPAHRARTTVDASAYYVTPGLIDASCVRQCPGRLPPGRSPHRLAQRQPRSQHPPPWRDDRRGRRQHRLEELRVVQATGDRPIAGSRAGLPQHRWQRHAGRRSGSGSLRSRCGEGRRHGSQASRDDRGNPESAPAGSRSRRCGAQHPRRRIDGGRGAGGVPWRRRDWTIGSWCSSDCAPAI